MASRVNDLMWVCRTCGVNVTASVSSCSTCGYGRTEFDLARSVGPGDTGSFVATRLAQPSFSELSKRTAAVWKRVTLAFAAGSSLVLLLMVLAYLKGC